MITASVEIGPMLAKLKKVQPLTSQSMKELIDQQVKLFVSDPRGKTGMLQLTPPASGGVTGIAAKKQGEAAVGRDIMRVFATAPQAYLEIARTNPAAAKGFYKAMLQGEYTEAERILQASGAKLRNVEIGLFNSSYHKSSRRNGKVVRHVPAQIVQNFKVLDAYIKKKQRNVGMLASGWNEAAQQFKASIPAWVKRHGTKFSSVRIKSGRTGYTVIMSSSVGFDQAGTARRARYAVGYRINAIKRRLPYLIKAAAKKATA